MNTRLLALLVVLLVVAMTRCGSESDPDPVLERIALQSSDGALIKVGEMTTMTANGFDSEGMPFDLSTTLVWSASNDHATITQEGAVVGISSGFTTIMAASGEIVKTLELRIWSDELKSISIVSSNGNRLDLGASTMLSAGGFDELQNELDIASELTWSVNNDHITIDQSGNVLAASVGSSIVTATVGSVTATTSITVWDSTAPRTEIYVSDAGNFSNPPWQILKYDENGENGEVFISTNLSWPQDILFLEGDGIVLISNFGSSSIDRYDITTGAYVSRFASGIGGPTRMKIGADGLLYVLQWLGNGRVFRYTLDGTFVDEFTTISVNESIGLDWDAEGNLYVSSFNGGSGGYVQKFGPNGSSLGKFISSGLQGPTNIWFDNEGNLMVVDWQAGRVVKFDPQGAFVSNFIIGLNQPEGIDFLSNGDILVGDGGNSAVQQFDSTGKKIKTLVRSGAAGLIQPNAVVTRRVNFE